MRASFACILVATASLSAAGTAYAQSTPAKATCSNADAIGLARTVEIDTSGGPGFGFEHFRQHDFLRNKEVILTFDDGPWPENTQKVLDALAHHCTKATFFPIGKHASYYPEILRRVAEAGHSIGNHTWGHVDLSKKAVTKEAAIEEIEKGISAVRMAVNGPTAPFFRFPALRHPPELVTYLGERNVGIFSTDLDSFDFTMRTPERIVKAVMSKLEKNGKGIVLMHDFQRHTADALPELLQQLKAGGYRIVHMVAREPVASLPKYEEMLKKDEKLPTVSQRPTANVVRTVGD